MISADLEKEILAQEEVVARILKIRSSDRPKAIWEKAGVIPAATAILTVLVTSIAGYYSQRALRDRESRTAIIRENTTQAREAAGRANTAVAGVLRLNQERLLMAEGEFKTLDSAQLSAKSRNSNRLQEEWRQQREDVEMELILVFDSSSNISQAWRGVRAALDSQTVCIEKAYIQVRNERQYLAKPACRNHVRESEIAISELRRALRTGYRGLHSSR